MARAWLAFVACTSLLVAGCIGDGDEAPQDEDLGADAAGGLVPGEIIDAPPAPTRDRAPSLEHAPEWQLGEWWTVRVTSAFDGAVYETTRVVAGFEAGKFLLAMPKEEFNDAIMVMHVPGFGQVDAQDLSFEVHDVLFEPLKFPLTDGATWETHWQRDTNPVTATVTVTSPTTAEIDLTGEVTHMVATYNAEIGDIERLEIDGYGVVEVLDHGMDYEGVVTVPHMHDLVFFHGRIAGVLAIGNEPAPPMDTVELDSGYDRVSFIILLGSVVVPEAPGLYVERATAPDGTVFEGMRTPADGPGITIDSYGMDDPGGTWEFTHVAAGPGITLFEGIAYHQYDVALPSGCILPAEGEHEHGDAGCGA